MASNKFSIPVDLDIDQIEKRFKDFLAHLKLDKTEHEEVMKDFGSIVLPNVERLLPLIRSGSNINFSKSLATSKGEVVVKFDSSKKGIFARILSALRQ
ncbi:hypothetical protein [Falsihalocynthiibacter sp. CO-5D18]|uniref:hypothetical protein n=1 Tax=Falsihalocynthiibacter sp. CO-5D18 TaxID=3240872 RepID=UPI00350F0F14